MIQGGREGRGGGAGAGTEMERWTERQGGVYRLEDKELNLRETGDREPKLHH